MSLFDLAKFRIAKSFQNGDDSFPLMLHNKISMGTNGATYRSCNTLLHSEGYRCNVCNHNYCIPDLERLVISIR